MKRCHIACDPGHISRKALVAYKLLFSSNQLSPGHREESIPLAATMPKKPKHRACVHSLVCT